MGQTRPSRRLGGHRSETESGIREAWPEFGADFRIIRQDGTIRWMETRSSVSYDPHGRPLRMIGVNVDVTDRKSAEEEVRRAKEQYETLVERLPDAVYSALPARFGAIVFLSKHCENWTGKPAEALYAIHKRGRSVFIRKIGNRSGRRMPPRRRPINPSSASTA